MYSLARTHTDSRTNMIDYKDTRVKHIPCLFDGIYCFSAKNKIPLKG